MLIVDVKLWKTMGTNRFISKAKETFYGPLKKAIIVQKTNPYLNDI
jgi:hypothetical protein